MVILSLYLVVEFIFGILSQRPLIQIESHYIRKVKNVSRNASVQKKSAASKTTAPFLVTIWELLAPIPLFFGN
jgi:hypothetical protein